MKEEKPYLWITIAHRTKNNPRHLQSTISKAIISLRGKLESRINTSSPHQETTRERKKTYRVYSILL